MKKGDETDRAFYTYIALQVFRTLVLLAGLAIIGYEISNLRGG